MVIFFRRSRVANSADPAQILPNFEPIQAFIAVIVTCKNKEDPMITGRAHKIFHIITLWELSVAMETRDRSDLAQNLMQPIPHPNDALDEI